MFWRGGRNYNPSNEIELLSNNYMIGRHQVKVIIAYIFLSMVGDYSFTNGGGMEKKPLRPTSNIGGVDDKVKSLGFQEADRKSGHGKKPLIKLLLRNHVLINYHIRKWGTVTNLQNGAYNLNYCVKREGKNIILCLLLLM